MVTYKVAYLAENNM